MLYVFKLLRTNKYKQKVITILVPKCLVWHLMQGLSCRLEHQKLEPKTQTRCTDMVRTRQSVYISPRASLTRAKPEALLPPTHLNRLAFLICEVEYHLTCIHL